MSPCHHVTFGKSESPKEHRTLRCACPPICLRFDPPPRFIPSRAGGTFVLLRREDIRRSASACSSSSPTATAAPTKRGAAAAAVGLCRGRCCGRLGPLARDFAGLVAAGGHQGCRRRTGDCAAGVRRGRWRLNPPQGRRFALEAIELVLCRPSSRVVFCSQRKLIWEAYLIGSTICSTN